MIHTYFIVERFQNNIWVHVPPLFYFPGEALCKALRLRGKCGMRVLEYSEHWTFIRAQWRKNGKLLTAMDEDLEFIKGQSQ